MVGKDEAKIALTAKCIVGFLTSSITNYGFIWDDPVNKEIPNST